MVSVSINNVSVKIKIYAALIIGGCENIWGYMRARFPQSVSPKKEFCSCLNLNDLHKLVESSANLYDPSPNHGRAKVINW